MKKIKISDLPLYNSLKGLFVMGTNAENQSVKVGLEYLDNTIERATKDAKAAKEEVRGKVNTITFTPQEDMVVANIFRDDNMQFGTGIMLPAATQDKAGVMTAKDKKTIDRVSTLNVFDTGNFILTPLPKGYTPCEYLQSNGGYVDTGVVANAPVKLWGRFSTPPAPSDSDYGLLGACKGNTRLYLAHCYVGKYLYGYNALYPIKDNKGGNVAILTRLSPDEQYAQCDETIVQKTDAAAVSLDINMYLFAVNVDGSARYFAPAETRLMSCKIYSAGFAAQGEVFLDMKRDFVPCLNPEKVAGLYDLVEGKFYTSANDKAFTAVPVDKGDKELLYNCYEQNLLDNVKSKTNRFYSVATFNIPPHLRGRRISFSAKVIGDVVDGVDVVKKYGVCADAYTTKRESGFVWPNSLFNQVCIPDADGYIHYDNLVTGETSMQIMLYTYHHLRINTKDADNPLVTLSEPMLTVTPAAKQFEPPLRLWGKPSWLFKYQ